MVGELAAIQAFAPILGGLAGGGSTKVTQNTSLSSLSNTILNISNTTGGQGGSANGAPVSANSTPYISSSDGSGLAQSDIPAFGAFGGTANGADNLLNGTSTGSGATVSNTVYYAIGGIVLAGAFLLFRRRK